MSRRNDVSVRSMLRFDVTWNTLMVCDPVDVSGLRRMMPFTAPMQPHRNDMFFNNYCNLDRILETSTQPLAQRNGRTHEPVHTESATLKGVDSTMHTELAPIGFDDSLV